MHELPPEPIEPDNPPAVADDAPIEFPLPRAAIHYFVDRELQDPRDIYQEGEW